MEPRLSSPHTTRAGTAFWGSKAVLTAMVFDLFSEMAHRAMDARELRESLGTQPRERYDASRRWRDCYLDDAALPDAGPVR